MELNKGECIEPAAACAAAYDDDEAADLRCCSPAAALSNCFFVESSTGTDTGSNRTGALCACGVMRA